MNKQVSIILPTYNEKENLPILIDEIIQEFELIKTEYEIIIIDDHSPDGTWKVALDIEKKISRVKSIIRKKNKSLASAIKIGINNSSFPIICIMDTDFSHPPKDIPRMLQYIDTYDMVWASRYISGGNMEALGKKWVQKWFSYIFNLYLKTILRIQILDSTNGFFLTRRNVLSKINLDNVFSGYGDFAFKLLYKLRNKDVPMIEIPFTYEKRKYGISKTNIIEVSIKYFVESIKLILFK